MRVGPVARYAVIAALLFAGTASVKMFSRVHAQNSTAGATKSMIRTINYPVARKSDQVDDYHGVKVKDPYRWLEDLDSQETRNWVEAENKLSFDFLAAIPARSTIKDRLTKLWNFERYGAPVKEGKRYFYTRNSGLQNQSVLYTVNSLEGPPQLVLDPNTLSTDGTVALSGTSISDDGKLLAYSLSASGSDWQEWKVRDVESGKDLSDDLKWVKFSDASWVPNGKGFFYSRYDEPKGDSLKDTNYFQKLYYHELGSPQSGDALVYERPDQKDWLFSGTVTEDGQYLIVTVSQGTDVKTRVYFKDLKAANGSESPSGKSAGLGGSVVKLLDDFDAAYYFIGNDGTRFWFRTNLESPRGKVIEIDVTKPARSDWRVVISESKETIQSVSLVNHMFVVNYLKDAYSQVKIYDTNGRFVREVEFPVIGFADGFRGKANDKETFYSFTGFTTPTTIYRYDMVNGKSTVFRQPRVDFDPDDYETKQVF
jgi:prolyl oligopeptidase